MKRAAIWAMGCVGLLLSWSCSEGESASSPGTTTGDLPLQPSPAPGGLAPPGTSLPPPDPLPGVRFVGRVDTTSSAGFDGAGARFAWSGSGVVARFSGSQIAVRLAGGQQFTVLVDGVLQPKLSPTGGLDVLAGNLPFAEHTVELYRRTEANQGESQFLGLDLGDGALLAPPPLPERRIELVGDSITAGYGNEGADMSCPFTPDTENHYLTYGALAARQLGAELSTVAWSGKGVVCNYGDDPTSCSDPLPPYYERTLPARVDSVWSFSDWQPQAVVVNLGTNDFSTTSDPTQAEFEAALGALLARIRSGYPDALILATVGPLLNGTDLSTARSYVANAAQARNAAGDARVKSFELTPTNAADGYGCDYHPSLRTHEIMGETLAGVLRACAALAT
jgi:lysophospholipase L1-like esterase